MIGVAPRQAGKLGKKAASYDDRDLKFAAYRTGALPTHPRVFGHENLLPKDLGMLGNDGAGDCVWAGAAHETMLFCAEAGVVTTFDDACVLGDYSAVTGYDPNNPDTDQGTDMRTALKYRMSTGIADASGKRHKIGAFVATKPGDVNELLEAAYLFQVGPIGIKFPSSAMNQFNAGKPWSVVRGSQIEGGHYVPVVAVRGAGLLAPYADTMLGDAAEELLAGSTRDIVVVTWGRLQAMTFSFFETYCDESYAILSPEMMKSGKSIDGFDLSQLQNDLRQVQAAA